VGRWGAKVAVGLPFDEVKGWRMLEGTWMLEHGRGFLPSSLPRVLGDVVWSAMDCWRIVPGVY